MEVITKKISDLKFADRNARIHGDRQIKEYIRSIEMFGQVRPLVVDEDNVVICGNGLLQALQKMEKETAECFVVGDIRNKKMECTEILFQKQFLPLKMQGCTCITKLF